MRVYDAFRDAMLARVATSERRIRARTTTAVR